MDQTGTRKFDVDLTDAKIQNILAKGRKHNPRFSLLSDRSVFTILFAEDCFACDGVIRIESMKPMEKDVYLLTGVCDKCGRTSIWPAVIEFSTSD